MKLPCRLVSRSSSCRKDAVELRSAVAVSHHCTNEKGISHMKTKLSFVTLAAFVVSIMIAQLVRAAENVSPAPSPGMSSSLPRPDFHFPGNVGRTFEDSDPPIFPKVVRPPQGAPNVLLILIDDAGFGQFSTFGGGVPSPNIDKLAAQGLRYTRFHTTALCSPTRAALLTGRDHHV